MPRVLFVLALAGLIALTAWPARAELRAPVVTLDRSWPRLAATRHNGCTLAITGNGRFLSLQASGLIPGEPLELILRNGDMPPLRARPFADPHGRWTRLYIPFRFNRPGGLVRVVLHAARCRLDAAVRWRPAVRVIA